MKVSFGRKDGMGGAMFHDPELVEPVFDPTRHVPGLSWGGKPKLVTFADWERMSDWCRDYYLSGGASEEFVARTIMQRCWEMYEFETRLGFSEWPHPNYHPHWGWSDLNLFVEEPC